ncbi:MAG: bifunctional ADP-dependent NAD(P)H-hydrate dehydratase/NAD(P)H-hydrate epimerase [Oryzihumus sp.]
MIDAYAVEDVRAAEEAAMAALPEGELMQRAAAGLAEVVAVRVARDGHVVAVVGGGNNGGDALYAAARLAERGFAVGAVTVSGHPHERGLEAALAAGVEVVESTGESATPEAARLLAAADVVIDGVLGIGGRPGLPPAARAVFDLVPDEAWLVAVDLPSGADPSGQDSNADRVFADETVTFGVAKPVHLLPATESAVGRLTVVGIGLEVDAVPAVQRLTHDDAARMWPVPGPGDDKYSRGVLGVVAGGEHYTGAALLSVTSAVCAGVGMVRYVGPPTPTALVRAQVPEAVMGPGRVQAWVVGPGLDAEDGSEAGRAQVAAARDALASGEPCVVDAGALDLIDGVRSTPTLLTPHAGELARAVSRLTGREVTRAQVAGAPVSHARELADQTGCTVLLKGSTTLVVPPGSSRLPIRSQADAPAWLATAGSGDVLAGLAGTLLAAGLSPLDAGSLAALVHGLAGHAANPGGPVRALALAHGIPGVVAGLLERPPGRA